MKLMLYEEWLKSPHQDDGLSIEKERELRNEIIEFMLEYGPQIIGLSEDITYKAIMIFHRFSQQISFKKFDRFLYAATSMFLAAKLEDKLIPLDTIVKSFLYLSELKREKKPIIRPTSDILEEYFKNVDKKKIKDKREKFCDAEIHILKMIGYDFDLELPYKYLDDFFLKYELPKDLESFPRISKNFVNDSFRTTMCLYYESHKIALVGIHLAQLFFNYNFGDYKEKKWFQFFDEDICEEEIKKAAEHMKVFYMKKK